MIDYLIIGQGLAGSLLAWELLKRGLKVRVIDNSHSHASSMVAAGLVNPVTGKRLLKADDTEACLAAALDCYHELEESFNRTFYHPLEMLRLFTDPQQAQTLEKRIADPAYAGFFGDSIQAAASRLPFRHDAGGIYQHKTGFLDIPLLLSSLKQYFFQRGLLGEKQLAYQEIEPSPPGVDYNGIQAARCIFCEGYQAQNNPWFEWLPFQPAKGEILTIESRQIPATHIVNRGNWLIPVSNNRFRTGATNQWQFTDDLPSQSGRDTVEAGLRVLFTETPGYQVIDHKAGIRPATRDKKPFIGLHPQFRQLGIFNGFGARGSLMIPYYARLFSRSLAANDRLPETVDIQRYYPQ